jgi:preprotein translocase subunit SecD
VSSSKAAVKIDSALLGTTEDALKAAGITVRGASLDATGIKIRFPDQDTQLKAKDLLQQKLGEDYIVALNLLSSSPQWLASIGALPMYLGLDLRGGVHFLLQVDMKAALDKAADRYTTDIRSLLREKKVQYSGVGREGRTSSSASRDEPSARRPVPRSRRRSATSPCRKSAPAVIFAWSRVEAGSAETHQDGAVLQNITILRNRVNELGVAERSSSSRDPTA